MNWVIAAGVVILGSAIVVLLRQRAHHESGITSFRRHIDALSPEARREVMRRTRRDDLDEGEVR